MYCKYCGKKCGRDICVECEEKNASFNNDIKQNKSNKKMSVSEVIGMILIVGTLGILPVHLFIWFALGISEANMGDIMHYGSTYYAIGFLVTVLLGLILAIRKLKIILIILGAQAIIILLLMKSIGFF